MCVISGLLVNMPTMATTAIASCIFSAEIVLSIITLSINGVVLNSLVHNRKVKSKHFNMLLVKMTFDSSFLLGTIVYSGSVLLNLAGIINRPNILFFTGNVVESLEAAVGALHLFLSLDRLCAMKRPVEYETISAKIQKVTVLFIAATFIICFVLYGVTRDSQQIDAKHLFSHFVNVHVQVDVHIVTFCVFLLSLLASVKFSVEYKRYLNTRVVSTTATDVNKVKKINRVVLHLLVSEFLLLIVPNTVEIVLKKIFDGNEVHRYGPINHPLIVVYTTLSAIVFCAIFPKK
ncbi:hypothetical protein QR680_010135 [Steinernema hermaphroditum]|uniref:G-protein coupled receptors family 1 profile domain-containing protein n=1 Tax=Steinernema hermaphroditum TaxID=289476 RepID=A0AA39IP85_9BILA|nr:hypothetical protein QR680_010135 [Steinernema hermaphroditum]